MNSLVFDWQARRFVEINVNFFILEGLRLPHLTDEQYELVGRAAARLSCVDSRFSEFAESVGVEVGDLNETDRSQLLVEIDAQVANAWGVTVEEMGVILSDFSEFAVPREYRALVVARLRTLQQGV